MTTTPRPLISIVIPCYRQAGYLPVAVDSALGQLDADVEVIVVDDGSPDDTAAVAERYGQQVILIRQANAGVAAARNAGLARASGVFVHFLDADDFLLPSAIATHLRRLLETGADVSCSGWNDVDAAGELLRSREAPSFEPDPFHALLPENRCPPVCYLFKRSVVAAVGGFDPDRTLAGHADWDLLLRITAAGARFVAVPEVLAGYRYHEASLSHRYAGMYDSGVGVLDKIRAIHPSCAMCGNRWREAYAFFAYNYVDCLVRPTFRRRKTAPIPRGFWKHYLLRSMRHPGIVWETLKYLVSAGPRLAGLGKADARGGAEAVPTTNQAGSD